MNIAMNIDQHDFYREFPEHQEAIRQLKQASPHFARLFADYRRVNREVERAEEHDVPLSDVSFEDLKKQRLKLKDELYALLFAKPPC